MISGQHWGQTTLFFRLGGTFVNYEFPHAAQAYPAPEHLVRECRGRRLMRFGGASVRKPWFVPYYFDGGALAFLRAWPLGR